MASTRTIIISSIVDLQPLLPPSSLPPNFTLHFVPPSLLLPSSSSSSPLLSLPPQTHQALQEATVCLADPSCAAPLLPLLPNLRWWQSTWAGVEPILNYAKNQQHNNTTTTSPLQDIKITRLGGCFGLPIGEFVFSHILSQERNLPQHKQNQLAHHWPPPRSPSLTHRPLSSMKMVVLGLGSIGAAIAKLGRAFEMTVVGVKRTAGGGLEGVEVVATEGEGGGERAVREALSGGCDYLVNTLPSTAGTKNLLNCDTLSCLGEEEEEKETKKRKPVFINVGRADITNEKDLLLALERNWLRGAVLDVFEQEPLPTSSPLWDHEKIVISPHCSGVSFPEDVVRVFVENLSRFLEGEEMLYEMEWERGG